MPPIVPIEKLAEVRQASMFIIPNKRVPLTEPTLQTGTLPYCFFYGEKNTLRHTCTKCQTEVSAELNYGGNTIEIGRLSQQGFNENRAQLDIAGKLFDQYLTHEVDINNAEIYLYESHPDENRGALLSVFYHRCLHCQAQYLTLYQAQLKDDRPPFEPDEILIDRILQVQFDDVALLQAIGKLNPISQRILNLWQSTSQSLSA